nr:hypothetical protein [Tanacetum cinerariifolium]
MGIMNRLPVKSLLQFRVVSKQWKFSIDNFDFIRFRNFDSNLNVFSLKPVASSEGEFRIIYAWALEFEDGIISLCNLLFTIPRPAVHFFKLLGFSNANEPIVEAEIVQQCDSSNLKVDSNLYQLSKMDASFNNENEAWEYSLDIDDSDLHLTPAVRSSNSTHVKPSPYTTNPVAIIPSLSGAVHVSSSTRVEPSTSNLNPVRIIPGPAVVEDVGDNDDFKSAAWVCATNYVNTFAGTVTGCLRDVNNFLKNRKLELVVGIVKSCSPNMLGDLNVTMKDLSGIIRGIIHHKLIGKGGYGKDITVGAAMILKNVSVFFLTHQSITLI